MLNKGKLTGFEWDRGNADKSYQKHGISPRETEEVFLDERVQLLADIEHSQKEKRFIAIGKNFSAKILFVVFTIRGSNIRVISARLANAKERKAYEEAVKKNPTI